MYAPSDAHLLADDQAELGNVNVRRRIVKDSIFRYFTPKHLTTASTLYFPGHLDRGLLPKSKLRFPYSVRNVSRNRIRNQRYSLLSFLPLTLYHQFNYFFNIFYLVVGLSQLFPQFVIGPLFTYLAPLGFVVAMSLGKEAMDDYKRFCRDKELNSQLYEAVTVPDDLHATQRTAAQLEEGAAAEERDVAGNVVHIKACDIQVGDVLRLHTGQRVPADCLLIKTFNAEGTCFVRTDQLDGETDWKLKRSVGVTQKRSFRRLIRSHGLIDIEAPRKNIYEFAATCSVDDDIEDPENASDGDIRAHSKPRKPEKNSIREPLNVENALWTNVIMTSGPVLALVIFTGDNTRAAKHRGRQESKISAFDIKVNRISKYLCAILCFGALMLTLGKPLNPLSGVYFVRFVLLLSSVIPISLRVNFDMAKLVFTYFMTTDTDISGTIVRNTNLPEELGGIDLIVSDKTGTLTQNRMKLQSIVVANKLYNVDNIDSHTLRRLLTVNGNKIITNPFTSSEPQAELARMIYCMALCHSVIPAYDLDRKCTIFEASSPDEMAMVQWCSNVGFKLLARDTNKLTLQTPSDALICDILETFTFSSTRKRMGIILKERESGQIIYLLKGAEVALLKSLKSRPQWLIEELDNLSTSGLRTLLYSYKLITAAEWGTFKQAYSIANNALVGRSQQCHEVIDSHLEHNMQLIGLTGVEDELQANVADTIESLIQAGIRIWMLTGDKVDTALCIATSAGLKGRMDVFIKITSENCSTPADIATRLRRLNEGYYQPSLPARASLSSGFGGSLIDDPHGRRSGDLLNVVVCIDNEVVNMLLEDRELAALFVAATARCKSVLCCRCSPSQKAQIVGMMKARTSLRIAAVGDGGNDVPMIQAAHCGIGILGREGRQASLAADFSMTEFRYLKRLMLWHGRLAQLRLAKLSNFIIHRGLVISVIQIFFSSVFYFTPLALFQGWLQVGYSTYYTMLPVFSLVLDQDVPPHVCFLFPEIYKVQDDHHALSDLSFGWIVFASIYQGAAIMVSALILFDEQLINFVAIAFTALIILELLNIASEILTWHRAMVFAELLSISMYAASIILLPAYFNIEFVMTSTFWSKVSIITLIAWLPVHCYKFLQKLIDPPQYTKLVA